MNYESLIKQIIESKKKIAEANSNISIWDCWYKGKVPSFHRYYIYNGSKKVYRERLSMHMAKKCCEDWASLLMNEKVTIGVKSQDLLEKTLIEIDFYNKANKSVEYGFALSMAGICVDIENLSIEDEKVNVTDKTYVTMNVYSAKKIVPLTFKNNECVECAFVREDTKTTKITIHLMNEDKYDILVATIDNETGTISETFTIRSDYKLFAIVHPQIVNNLDVDSPYSMSIFGNATDTLKSIDTIFDSYANEFTLGRKRIFVSTQLDKVDKATGDIERTFDPNDLTIHQIPESVGANGEPKPLIYEANGALRAAEHSQAIQDMLNYFSSQVGLGVDYYRFEKGRVMTATQVISEKSDTFRNLKKHEGIFEKALISIIKAIQYAHNEFTTSQEKFKEIEDITVNFDDSIIEDKNTEKEQDQKDVQFGAMSLVNYRMKWYAEDEQTAMESMKKIYGDADFLKRLQNFSPYLMQGVLSPLEFVKVVYIDITNTAEQESLAEEIKQNLKSSSEVFSDADLMNLKVSTTNEK